MVGNHVQPPHMLDRINQHGVNFDLTPEQQKRLKNLKVEDSVVETIADPKKK